MGACRLGKNAVFVYSEWGEAFQFPVPTFSDTMREADDRLRIYTEFFVTENSGFSALSLQYLLVSERQIFPLVAKFAGSAAASVGHVEWDDAL